ncbi:hypothetical protein T492DRAFT_862960 [Pavlovales sp. CCMP2436]|nr:hypothetical protein T492DRAFT_862960 [Pavlovales sp. CCMP2436]
MHKILQGLIDQHSLAKSVLALDLATGLATYLCDRFGELRTADGLQLGRR